MDIHSNNAILHSKAYWKYIKKGWDFQLTLTYPWYPIQDIQV